MRRVCSLCPEGMELSIAKVGRWGETHCKSRAPPLYLISTKIQCSGRVGPHLTHVQRRIRKDEIQAPFTPNKRFVTNDSNKRANPSHQHTNIPVRQTGLSRFRVAMSVFALFHMRPDVPSALFARHVNNVYGVARPAYRKRVSYNVRHEPCPPT